MDKAPVLARNSFTHEELWFDRVVISGGGTGDDALDVTSVSLVHDRDGNGTVSAGDTTIAAGAFDADNGTVVLDGFVFELDAGTSESLLVVYDVTVASVSSSGTPSIWWAVPLAVMLLLRRQRGLLVLMLALVPLSCGGGGAAALCTNSALDPAGAIVTFQPRIEAGSIRAFTATGGGAAQPLVTATLQSGTLSVSN